MCTTTLLGTDTKDFIEYSVRYPEFCKLFEKSEGSDFSNTMILSDEKVLKCINFIYLPYTNVYYNSTRLR